MSLKKLFLNFLGFLCLGVGAVGIILPGLPTTPFVILAAICFSKSNDRIFLWLERSKYFGPYIVHYRTKRGVSRRLKFISIAFVWISLAISIFLLQTTWAYVILPIVGICVGIHIMMIKTKAP